MTKPDESPGHGSGNRSTPGSRSLQAAFRRSRRFLHLTLIMLVVVPVVVWLIGPDDDDDAALQTSDGAGEPAPDFTVDLSSTVPHSR